MDIDWLREVERTYKLEKESTALLVKTVTGARQAGLSWDRIATAMGISQQGARQRFRAKVPEKLRESVKVKADVR